MLRLFLCLLVSAALWGQEPFFLVSQKAASSVAFYTWEGKNLAIVPVGKHPHEIVLSRDGRHAYVTDNGTMAIEQAGEGGNTMSIIDVRERKRVGVVSLGKYHRPHGIDVHPKTGEVLVTSENPDQLLIIDPNARKVLRTYDTKGQTPHIVTAGKEGKWAYVSNARSGTVSAVELASGEVTLIKAGDRPEGSVLTGDGSRLYVANRDSNEISIIDTQAKKNIGTIATGRGPVRIGLSADEKYVVYALLEDKKVGFADVQARKEVALVDLDGSPVSMHTSPDGKYALTAAQEEDTIYVISMADKKLVKKFKTAPGAGPDPVMLIQAE